MPPFYKGPRTKQDDTVKTVGRKGSMQTGQQVLRRQTRTSVHSFHYTNAVKERSNVTYPRNDNFNKSNKKDITNIILLHSLLHCKATKIIGDELATP